MLELKEAKNASPRVTSLWAPLLELKKKKKLFGDHHKKGNLKISPQYHKSTLPTNLIFPKFLPVFVEMSDFYVTVKDGARPSVAFIFRQAVHSQPFSTVASVPERLLTGHLTFHMDLLATGQRPCCQLSP